MIFQASGTFIVPANITKIRVRVVGGGGGGGNNKTGGGGGGYADGVFTVAPGTNYTVTVAAAPNSVHPVLVARKPSVPAVRCSAVAVLAVADILAVLGYFAAER